MKNLIPRFIHEQFKQRICSGRFQAATLFVDISGFTPLTETLMQHRKDGAEVLAEALSAIFGPLVHQVYARGGLIPLFAGDAFTALFPYDLVASPDAPLHALKIAFFIRQFFTPQGQDRIFHTKYGDFAIGVKAGLSLGLVRWGIPGQAGQHAFYFRGPAVDACAHAEHQATKGEIVADNAIMPFIRAHVTAEPMVNTPYHQLTACSLELPAPGRTQPPFSRTDLTPFVSDAILDLPAKAEFREICPVFVSFEEPKDDTLLHEFIAQAIVLTHRYGGCFNQVDFGDKGGLLVLLFGAPVAHENDIERAAECLLALQQQNWPFRWRVGMTFGIVWGGIRGGVERCEYGAVGDVVNLAARLALKAEWGEVWASEAVYEHLKQAYRLDALGAFRIKGKKEAISVYRLSRKKELVEAFHNGRMVGRQAELTRLNDYVQPVFDGRFAGITYVDGEAGIGKSRLVRELERQLTRHGRVRWFHCPADAIRRQSLNPFKYFLHGYFEQSAEHTAQENKARFDAVFETLIQRLPGDRPATAEIRQELVRTRSMLAAMVDLHWEGSLYEQLEPKLRFDNTLFAFKNLIKAEASLQPVIIQLEDGHWLDGDSQQMMRVLTRDVADYPLAMICTARYRDDGHPYRLAVDEDVPQREIDLSYLPPEGIQAFAAQVLQGTVTDEVVHFLADKTNGNPFFIEQLALDLRERGFLVEKETANGRRYALGSFHFQDVPSTVNAVLVSRLDRLVTEVKQVVQTAAVLGREFEVQILSHMLQGDQKLPVKIKIAEQAQVWLALSELRYLFRHALLRDAAYGMQLRARLRELHRLAAAAIERVHAADPSPHYADLAYHCDQAEAHSQAARWYRLAGERAASQHANQEAVTCLSRALDLTPEDDLTECYALLLAREKVYDLQGEREAQRQDLAALEGLAEALADKRRQAEVALRQANYADATGDYPAVIASAQAAVGLAQTGQAVRFEAAGYLQWGRALWRQGDYEAARPQLEQALALAQAAQLRQASRGPVLSQVEGPVLSPEQSQRVEGPVLSPEPSRRVEGPVLSGTKGEAEGLSRTVEADSLRNLGTVTYYLSDYAAARSYYEQSLRICREIGDRRGEGDTLGSLGLVSGVLGDYAAAGAYHEQALRIYREIGDRRGESRALNNLGVASGEQSDFAEARTYFEQALRIHREVGDRRSEGNGLNNLGGVCVALGDYAGARAYHEQALRICREIRDRWGEGFALNNLGLVSRNQGDYAGARAYLEQTLHIAQELGDRRLQGYVLTSLGHALAGLGHRSAEAHERLAEAAAACRQALALRRELGQHNLAMESLAGLAHISLAQEDLTQAQAHVEEILSHLESHTPSTGSGHGLDGTEEPLRVYLTCYRVLRANRDTRAGDILDIAHTLLQERAAKIPDEEMRRSFLKNVTIHRKIVREWRMMNKEQGE